MRKMILQLSKKKKIKKNNKKQNKREDDISLPWNIMFTDKKVLKSCCFELFGNEKYGLFLNQKVDGNVIFTDY